MPFDTRGALWSDGVAQTHTALFIALVVQLVVLWFNITNKGFWPVIGGIPILLMWKRYRDRAAGTLRGTSTAWRGAGCR